MTCVWVSCDDDSKWFLLLLLPFQAIRGSTGVVNLAGEPIATRWDAKVKEALRTSRLGTTDLIVRMINECPEESRPEVLVSSSAVGFYGTSETATFDEASPPGSDFLARLCEDWEQAAYAAKCDRTVVIRTGIVLAKEGGALAKMLPVFQIFAGGPLGGGNQWFSWIHRDDLCGIVVMALKDQASFRTGAYNGTAPEPVTMNQVCAAIGKALGRPSWMPVPDIALSLLLGEGAMVVLEGQKVLPVATEKAGYNFRFRTVQEAVNNIVGK